MCKPLLTISDIVSKDKVCGKGGNTLVIDPEYIGKSIRCIVNSKSQDGYIEGEYTVLENDYSKPSSGLGSNRNEVRLVSIPDYFDKKAGKILSVLKAEVNLVNKINYKYEWWYKDGQHPFRENTPIITLRPELGGQSPVGKIIEFRAISQTENGLMFTAEYGPITENLITKNSIALMGNMLSEESNADYEQNLRVGSFESISSEISAPYTENDTDSEDKDISSQKVYPHT